MTIAAEPGAPATNRYLIPNAAEGAGERLRLLAEIFDPGSKDAIRRAGICEGRSCWEVGAGTGSIARWMAEEVGPRGRVLATDLDPRFLQPLAGPTIEVLRHDVVADATPTEGFDIVHTRLLLFHLTERELVLDRLIAALKPGGWLVVEDFDCLSTIPDATANPFETPLQSVAALREFFARSGLDLRIGRRLTGMLRARGLADVRGEGRMFMWQDGTIFSRFQRLTLEQAREGMTRAGLVRPQQLDCDLEAMELAFLAPSPVLWSAIGRRPAS